MSMTWWNEEKVKELQSIVDTHIDICEECQESFEKSGDEAHYCDVGEELLNEFLEADMEYSWQHDFDGFGATEAPGYNVLCPCNSCFIKTMRASCNIPSQS
tara:strand:+ start:567 stop:869 length:303 start_codon:yes stop_codon:yes gene_type:complete